MAAVNTHRIWFIVRGMTEYVNRIYKSAEFEDDSSEITMEEDLYLPRQLKTVLHHSVDNFKNEKFVIAHNHCVDMPDREKHVKKSFQSGLIERAREQTHVQFLQECVLYIMSATEMEQLCFPEAKNIVMRAIYQACMNSEQHKSLVLWVTQPKEKENSVPKNFNHEEEPSSSSISHQDVDDNDSVLFSSEVDIID